MACVPGALGDFLLFSLPCGNFERKDIIGCHLSLGVDKGQR